jgi:hypothetical protein
MKFALAILQLIATVFTWWIKNNSSEKEKHDATKKEIHEAIASGDVARVHRIIDKLRKS